MSTISSLGTSDNGANSMAKINTNFSNLNTDKLESSDGADIKTAYEGEADTNAYTDAEKTKLTGVEASADVTDAGNVGSSINGATAKTIPVDADSVGLIDSAASNVLKKLTWANVKATLKTYFDTLYALASHSHTESDISDLDHDADKIKGVTVDDTDKADGKILKYNSTSGNLEYEADNEGAGGGDSDAIHDNVSAEISAITAKTTPVDADVALIEDSAASNAKKKLSWANIKATLKTYFDTLYTDDQTGAEIKTAYEGESNTNAFTDSEKTLLGNQSGTNTGDESSATALAEGVVELATPTEVYAGADTERAVTPEGNKKGTIHTMQVVLEASDTDLAAGTTVQGDFRIPGNRAITIKAVGAYVDTAGVTGATTFDINEGGTSILSTKITIDTGEKTSTTAATPPVISDSAIAADAVLTFDIDGVSSGTAPKGGKIWIEYVYA